MGKCYLFQMFFIFFLHKKIRPLVHHEKDDVIHHHNPQAQKVLTVMKQSRFIHKETNSMHFLVCKDGSCTCLQGLVSLQHIDLS